MQMTSSSLWRPAVLPAVLVLAVLAVPMGGCQQQQAQAPLATVATPPYAGPRPELQALRNPSAPLGAAVLSGMASVPKTGTKLALSTRTAVPAYLTLYHVAASGRPAVLMENVMVQGGVSQSFPGPHHPSNFVLVPPAGVESFILVATTAPFAPNLPKAPTTGTAASLQVTYPQLLDLLGAATRALPANTWDISILNVETRT